MPLRTSSSGPCPLRPAYDAPEVPEHRVDYQEAIDLQRAATRASAFSNQQTDVESSTPDSNSEFSLKPWLERHAERSAEAGLAFDGIGVSFRGLSVLGPVGVRLPIPTIPSEYTSRLAYPLQFFPIPSMQKPKHAPIIHDLYGYARPGEMVLVLGRPGSGCSTLLKTIANRTSEFSAVTGDIKFAGLTADEFVKRYASQSVYNEEADHHNPTLTVEQTIAFAVTTKTPRSRPGQIPKEQYVQEMTDLYLKMLKIDHTRNTMVGDEFVRGVSGGERKRVSIAEVMATGCRIGAWDNSTKGLDSSTSLDFAKSLRILTDVNRMTNFVSLYQTSEAIYEQFDKVMILDQGHQIFFGPVSSARQYFVDLGYADLPRQTTADYLSGCTDPKERRFQPGRSSADVPSTPMALEAAFRASPQWGILMAQIEQYEMDVQKYEPHLALEGLWDKQRRAGVSQESPYMIKFTTQVATLIKRETQIKLQSIADIIVEAILNLCIAILIGTAYWNQPETSAGAFTRGGLIYLTLLYCVLGSFLALPTQMGRRNIVHRHVSFRFFRPSALALASVITDLPFTFGLIVVFLVPVYFLSGLWASAGAFFIFLIFTYTCVMMLGIFFRATSYWMSDFESAGRFSGIFITGTVVFSGYVIPRTLLPDWLVWLYYINPVRYAWEGAMESEFRHINFKCSGQNVIPRNIGDITKYPQTISDQTQTCTLGGATPGLEYVSGKDYLKAMFGIDANSQTIWLNFGIIVVFIVGFLVLHMLGAEVMSRKRGQAARMFFKHTKQQEAKEKEKDILPVAAPVEEKRETHSKSSTGVLTWENMNYTVPVSGGTRQLLENIDGYCKPGTITALMGSSGAGKTTLLDVLAMRKNIGVISGDVLLNGRALPPNFAANSAYAEQLDVHEDSATVRESLQFSAYLRQDTGVSNAEKDAYVEEIIELLELTNIVDAQVGAPGSGISVEARKRLTIGVELVSKPEILFLDEPTSGLDGQSAYNIVLFLRKLASSGIAILCTIHQPSALLLGSFDRLLVLQKGGRTVYNGDLGPDSTILLNYLRANGAYCPPEANPAEFVIDVVVGGSQDRQDSSKPDWSKVWAASPECAQVKAEIKALSETARNEPVQDGGSHGFYITSTWYQLKVVTRRALVAQWRMAAYQYSRIVLHASIGLMVSLTWMQLGSSVADMLNREFCLFIIIFLPSVVISQVQPLYMRARDVYIREQSSRMYSQPIFALSQFLAEVPGATIAAVVYFLFFYFIAGFNTAPDRAGYHILLLITAEIYAVAIGQAICAFVPNLAIAGIFVPFILIVYELFAGVTIPGPDMIKFYRVWLYELNPYTRLISGLLTTELHGLKVECAANEWAKFQPPRGETCVAWAGDFVTAVKAGYLGNPDATSDCLYCPYRSGDDFTNKLEFYFDDRWRDWGILVGHMLFALIALMTAARYISYIKR